MFRALIAFCVLMILFASQSTIAAERPNFVFAIADDWGYPHASQYGDPVVKTPHFDRIARDGILFQHAYVSSPSCTPSRGAVLTGQFHWRLDGAANLFSVFPDRFTTYPEILKEQGYHVGYSGKGWGPGRTETANREIVGKRYKSFQEFMNSKTEGESFCYWLGTSDPHRPFKAGSGKAAGMDISKIKVPECFPDSEVVRNDIADYYVEVQRFDRLVGDALKTLEDKGVLNNTVVIMTSDHGMPFPRCKSNLYDTGTRVPFAVMWPKGIPSGRVVQDFVSLTDIAPTFLQLAGIEIPGEMTGTSLTNIFSSDLSGKIEKSRSYVLTGKERHVPSQEAPDLGGYPSRAIRTDDYLYIMNFKPDRWPNGTENYRKAVIPGTWFGDTDNGPTKTYMVENREKDDTHRVLFDRAFGKRPSVELYHMKDDAGQLRNLAGDPGYKEIQKRLELMLKSELRKTEDPRIVGNGDRFDEFPYLGGGPKYPGLKKPNKKKSTK